MGVLVIKRLLAAALALVMLFSFAACREDADSSTEVKENNSETSIDAVPEAVIREIEAYYDEDLKADIGEMKVQYTASGYGAYFYVISCEIINVKADSGNDYEGCWFWGISYGCDDVAKFMPRSRVYNPDEMQALEDDCKAFIEEVGEEWIDKALKNTAEEIKGISYDEDY